MSEHGTPVDVERATCGCCRIGRFRPPSPMQVIHNPTPPFDTYYQYKCTYCTWYVWSKQVPREASK